MTTTLQRVSKSQMYDAPIPSPRTGPLYNAFSYPTKISPETIAVFIAGHTKPGDVILDTFSGTGTTGLGALLCEKPTPMMLQLAKDLKIVPAWGPRETHLIEVGSLGAFIASVLCDPPNPRAFTEAANSLIRDTQREVGWMYAATSPDGELGDLRHAIWSDVLVCPQCSAETPFWQAVVRRAPLRLDTTWSCPSCHATTQSEECDRAEEVYTDDFLGRKMQRRKRKLVYVYGESAGQGWQRPATDADRAVFARAERQRPPKVAPKARIVWGDLFRGGYHFGISHLHHFYTSRNFRVMSTLWERIDNFPSNIQKALRLLVLSYNASHSTLMTRIVVKTGQRDFVLTGAQSGVLYISGLPVEKNILRGISRKTKQMARAFGMVHGCRGRVVVHHASSTSIPLPDDAVDYLFTDPPFGGFIPYAEINQINELWLAKATARKEEIIISPAQGKGAIEYGAMLSMVFKEAARVLKPGGLATVVFHSGFSDVWKAIMDAFNGAGLAVVMASVLHKEQASFKQTVSEGSVQGDPLLLLRRRRRGVPRRADSALIAAKIISGAKNRNTGLKEVRRLYSEYVLRCLIQGSNPPIGAKAFYQRLSEAKGQDR